MNNKNSSIFFPITILVVIFCFLMIEIVANKYQETINLKQLETKVQLSSVITNLVHQTQIERGMSSGYIASHGKIFVTTIKKQRQKTTKALNDFKKMILKDLEFSENKIHCIDLCIDLLNNLKKLSKKEFELEIKKYP